MVTMKKYNPSNRTRILICDDDVLIQKSLQMTLSPEYELEFASRPCEAIAKAKKTDYQIALVDIEFYGKKDGLTILKEIRSESEGTVLIVFSGHSDFSTIREAMRNGASDYILKDTDPEEIRLSIRRAEAKFASLRNERQLQFEVNKNQDFKIIGNHPVIEKIQKTILKLKNSKENILIQGETGTGKELVARQLRKRDGFGNWRPFVTVDSSTIQSTIAESILFGNEKGAFTGALEKRLGLFEQADGGILYFDEIGNMPLEIQNKLLRAIQEKEIRRVGSQKTIRVDVQIIAATNSCLDSLCNRGEFKRDLLTRINVIPIHVPSLRERKEDIPSLIQEFTKGTNINFTAPALGHLMDYSWPGNIRELKNLVAYLNVMSESPIVKSDDLPPQIKSRVSQPSHLSELTSKSAEKISDKEDFQNYANGFYAQIKAYEKAILSSAYNQYDRNISLTARNLKMDRSHLYSKLKAYEINRPAH